MTKEEAKMLLDVYAYHNEELAKAVKENDTEAIEIHERCLKLMEKDYSKASNYLRKLIK